MITAGEQTVLLLSGHNSRNREVYVRIAMWRDLSALLSFVLPTELLQTLAYKLQTMNFTARSLTVGLAVAALGALATPTLAQPDAQANPLADFQNTNSDPFSSGSNANSNMMNLMHRMMLGDQGDPTAFAEAQENNMNDAMANFRAKQRQLIKARQAQLQSVPVVPSQPGVVQNCNAAGLAVGTTCAVNPVAPVQLNLNLLPETPFQQRLEAAPQK
jgi:hypothetical protein